MAYIDIILLAVLAGFIIWRLRSVLGRREGHEQPVEPYSTRRTQSAEPTSDNVVHMPGARDSDDQRGFGHVAPEGSELAEGLMQVQLADRTFDVDGFLEGARGAYEMIVTAFADGNRRELRPLLSDEVYRDFDSALDERESNGQMVETTFIGIDQATISGAEVRDNFVEVTVKFVSELISMTKNDDGVVIEGDPTTVRKVTDIWTFARDTYSNDPNWLLIATDEG